MARGLALLLPRMGDLRSCLTSIGELEASSNGQSEASNVDQSEAAHLGSRLTGPESDVKLSVTKGFVPAPGGN